MKRVASAAALLLTAAFALGVPARGYAQANPQPAAAPEDAGTNAPAGGLPGLRAAVPATAPAASPAPAPQPSAAPAVAPTEPIALTAAFGDSDSLINNGLTWRIFNAKTDAHGVYDLIGQSTSAAPSFSLPDGDYVVHTAYGLAGATKRIKVSGAPLNVRVPVSAGALRVTDMLGDAAIPPNRVALSFYVPEPGNNEAKLILSSAKVGDIIGLPEGTYHVVSTYLDLTISNGAPTQPGTPANSTNSVVEADFRVQTGKLTDVTLRHHAATLTLKLVNQSGGEALANTSFSVLTTGGDVIREMIGAFPSITLAEGEYIVIARRDGNTYQSSFTVQSAHDQDVEVIAK